MVTHNKILETLISQVSQQVAIYRLYDLEYFFRVSLNLTPTNVVNLSVRKGLEDPKGREEKDSDHERSKKVKPIGEE